VWSVGQFALALTATVAALVYLLTVPPGRPEPPPEADAPTGARSIGPGLVRVEPDTPLGQKVQVVEVRPSRVTTPVLTVTGTVVASLRPGSEKGGASALMAVTGGAPTVGRGSDYWQFHSPEVLTAFTDWQKAIADIAFARGQRVKIREAAVARTEAQQELVDTIASLLNAGTETKKQLNIERATLRQYQIQQDREFYETDTAVRVAERNEAALARQLQQAGLDPAMLTSLTSDVDIVMADVPETFLDRVKVGGACTARFFGVPKQVFLGHVKSIAPVVSKERRTLRVLFSIVDLNDQLRPGMFAEIGLGTDERDVLTAPAEGVLHIGRTDYLLVAAAEPGVWRATPVDVGELRDGQIEILNWLKPDAPAVPGTPVVKPGDRVLGQGAILLKPLIANGDRRGGGP
jgi:cobalt-zinc-cadmium efflux system membrane fusion protein